MNQELYRHLIQRFQSLTNRSPEIGVRAPGRINLIGEHTDYNMGFVLPAAIDKSIYIVAARNHSDQHNWYALDLDESLTIKTDQDVKTGSEWADFILGGLIKLREKGAQINGLDIAFTSDLPIGAGLSSSSALSCGMIFMANEIYQLGYSKMEVAVLGHASEREFIGVQGGIMDQFANMLGQQNRLLLLDCRSKAIELIQMPSSDCQLLLINTCVQHSLVESDYNVRSFESGEAAKIIGSHFSDVKSLRDVKEEMIDELSDQLGEVKVRRARYIVKENNRVLKMVEALESNDISSMGRYLFESHEGLKTDYEVSCAELDFLVDFAKEFEGVMGARMMGGGFGGCTINLVQNSCVEEFKEAIQKAYFKEFKIQPDFIPFTLSNGTSVIENE